MLNTNHYPKPNRFHFEQHRKDRGEFSTSNLRERKFRIEYKSFTLKIDNGGSSATIVEEIRNQKFSVSIDLGGVHWLINSFKRSKAQFSDNNFFAKYQASYALFLLQRYNNKNGSFISLSRIHQGMVKSVVVVPAGEEGK